MGWFPNFATWPFGSSLTTQDPPLSFPPTHSLITMGSLGRLPQTVRMMNFAQEVKLFNTLGDVRVRGPLGPELTSFKPPSHGPANTLPALSFRTCCSFHLRSPHSDISPSNMIKTSFTHVSVLSTADGNHPLSQDSDPHLTHHILLTLPCLLSISLSNLLQSNDCHPLSCSSLPTRDRPFMGSIPPLPCQISHALTSSHHHRRTRLFPVPESLYFLTIPAHSCHLVSPKPFMPCKPTLSSHWHQVLTSEEVEYAPHLTILEDTFSDLMCVNTVFQYLTPSFFFSVYSIIPLRTQFIFPSPHICKSGRCSTVLQRGGTLWNAWNTCPVPEQCGMVWNGMEWVCLDNTCHPLSPPVNPRNGKILNWS